MAELKTENELAKKLQDRFKDKISQVEVKRVRRIWGKINNAADVKEVISYFKSDMGFEFLPMVSGLDSGENYEIIYHISGPEGILFNIKAFVPINKPDLDSVTEFYPGVANMERELTDMFGINVKGIPDGERYPLPEDWPSDSHPLRKNWKKDAPATEVK